MNKQVVNVMRAMLRAERDGRDVPKSFPKKLIQLTSGMGQAEIDNLWQIERQDIDLMAGYEKGEWEREMEESKARNLQEQAEVAASRTYIYELGHIDPCSGELAGGLANQAFHRKEERV